MPSVLTSRVKCNLLRGCAVATIAIGILLPTAASAQISRVGNSVGALEPGLSMRGTDTAYDLFVTFICCSRATVRSSACLSTPWASQLRVRSLSWTAAWDGLTSRALSTVPMCRVVRAGFS